MSLPPEKSSPNPQSVPSQANAAITGGGAGGQAWPASRCLHQWFEQIAATTPDAIALSCENRRWTYRELNQKANQLAHRLRKLGVGPEVLVGLCLDRTPELVMSILGILKAGGAYLPLDLAYPKDRVAFILEDAQAPVVVTSTSQLSELACEKAQTLCIDREQAALDQESTVNPEITTRPDHLAYVIYTSGSTGKPKGSLISHYNVVRLFQATEAWFHFGPQDVWTLFHSCAFDFSVWELWGALLYGGRLVVVPFSTSRTPEAFYRLLCDEKVTVLNQTPSAFRQLVRAEETVGQRSDLALRAVVFGGEALDMKTLKPWFDRHGDQRPQLINMYGITETTVHVTYRPLTAADLDSGSVIGIPIPDLQLHLLDEHLKPVPVGVTAEICVGGAGLGRGYWKRPELTAQKFVPDPFSQVPGARLYRSGDLGRYLPDGELEYLGRMDHQVKIRGFRIELGEIESAIQQHTGIRESLVLAREDTPGEKRLVAYLIRKPGMDVSLSELRQSLRERLPEYMVPSAFVWIEKLPLTINGKLDASALPVPESGSTESAAAFVAPETEIQRLIVSIWQSVLERSSIGVNDNFFDLGGNSILMAEVHSQMETRLRRQFPITDLFAHTTVRALAEHFAANDNSEEEIAAIQARARRQSGAWRNPRPNSSAVGES